MDSGRGQTSSFEVCQQETIKPALKIALNYQVQPQIAIFRSTTWLSEIQLTSYCVQVWLQAARTVYCCSNENLPALP